MKKIIIGTRGSQLALWQANYTKDILEKHGYEVVLNIISTKGDRTQEWNLSFDKIEGKGFFTKELEDALLCGEADLAVHSCKDMPTENAEGLTIAAYSYRANPYDVLLIHPNAVDDKELIPLKKGAKTGTSSARRKSQILLHRPDLEVMDLRGNVPTRIQKLKDGQYDAIILASAGIERLALDLEGIKVFPLTAPLYIPAPAQGVLAYQIRQGDKELEQVCNILQDDTDYPAIQLERDILHDFKGGCQIPLGVYAQKKESGLHLWISKAAAWDAPVQRTYNCFPGNIPSSKEIVAHFSAIQPKRVFISRELKADDFFLKSLSLNGFEVESESLVDIKMLSFEEEKNVDWLFFTSKNGVHHYFSKVKYSKENQPFIGAINAGTATEIKALGYEVHFQGSDADTHKEAQAFAAIAKGKVVLPQAKTSIGAIEKVLPEAYSLPVYENSPKQDFSSTDADILVFTSPMNAETYFKRFELKEHQQIISIGLSTEQKIKDLGYKCTTSFDPMPWSLVDAVMWASGKR